MSLSSRRSNSARSVYTTGRLLGTSCTISDITMLITHRSNMVRAASLRYCLSKTVQPHELLFQPIGFFQLTEIGRCYLTGSNGQADSRGALQQWTYPATGLNTYTTSQIPTSSHVSCEKHANLLLKSITMADPTARASNTTITWQPEPNLRGTFTIITTCAITLLLCVYSSVHLNLPAIDRNKTSVGLRRTAWIACALFAPEYIIFTAQVQRSRAKLLSDEAHQAFKNSTAVCNMRFYRKLILTSDPGRQ